MQSCCVCLHRIAARDISEWKQNTWNKNLRIIFAWLFFTQWQQQKSLKSDATHGRGQWILKETRNPIGACVSLDSFKSRLRASKSQRRMCDSERFQVTFNEESPLSQKNSLVSLKGDVGTPEELSLALGSSYLSSTRHSVKLARKRFSQMLFLIYFINLTILSISVRIP